MNVASTWPLADRAGQLRLLLLLACAAWLSLVAAVAPLAAMEWPYAGLLRWFWSGVCHQSPERSFHWFGAPLAVCHRCAGLYLGFALGVVLWPHLPPAWRAMAQRPAWLAACLALPLIDWSLPNSPASRFGTGLIAAFPVGLLALLALPSGALARPGRWLRRHQQQRPIKE